MKMAQQQLARALVFAMLVVVVAVNCDDVYDETNEPLRKPCKLPDGFQRCDNSGAYIKSFSVKGCEGGAPCKFKADEPIEIYIRFSAFDDYTRLVLNLDVTYDHYSKVIIKRDQVYYFQLKEVTEKILIKEDLRNILESDTMTLTLTNGSKTMVCLRFPVQVESGTKSSDYVDQLEGHFVLKRPDGKKISQALARQLVGQEIAWPSGAKLSKPQADQLDGARMTVTF